MWKQVDFGMMAVALAVAASHARAEKGAPPLETVPSVDLGRYAGKWYEIARLPNRFQRACAGDVTATYTSRPDGRISVLNECRTAEGRTKSARGTAKRADQVHPGKLKVTFFWPFYGDYWIIDLDPEYGWAVIGEPGRKYLWVLGREPRLDEDLYRRIVERASQKGFDTTRLLRTKHGAAAGSAGQNSEVSKS